MANIICAFIFITLSILLQVQAFKADCITTRCSHDGPDIQFPFRATGQQPQHCGYPGFDLVCKGNDTVLQIPSFGELIVKSISYDTNRMNLLDTKNCVSDVFLNLNLSVTPFRYYFAVTNYTYLNCSNEISLPDKFPQQVPCQSGSKHHVYIVKSSLAALPGSCMPVKTVAIPFPYSPYLYGDSFGLALSWDVPRCNRSETRWRYGFSTENSHATRCFEVPNQKGFLSKQLIIVLSMGFFVLMVATLTSIKVYHSWKQVREKDMENQQKLQMFLQDYKNPQAHMILLC